MRAKKEIERLQRLVSRLGVSMAANDTILLEMIGNERLVEFKALRTQLASEMAGDKEPVNAITH